MSFFSSPSAFRSPSSYIPDYATLKSASAYPGSSFATFQQTGDPPHQHPPMGHLMLLVFEAVLEVVCVSLPGYIVARQGMFNIEMQKFTANLNVALFTPCLSMVPSSLAEIDC